MSRGGLRAGSTSRYDASGLDIDSERYGETVGRQRQWEDKPSRSGQQFHVKVTSLAVRDTGGKESGEGDDDGAINMLPLTTLDFVSTDMQAFKSRTTLLTVRYELEKLLQGVNQIFKFCTTDCSTVTDDLSLENYLKLLGSVEVTQDNLLCVYITGFSKLQGSSTSALCNPPFQIKFVRETDTGRRTEGSLHSTAFKGQNAEDMPLYEIRRLIKSMSRDPAMDVFCSADGAEVTDDLSLGDYLHLDDSPLQDESGVPSIFVSFRKAGSAKLKSSEGIKFHGASPEVLAMTEQMKSDLSFRDRSQDELKADTTEFKVQEQLDASQFAAREANPVKYTGQMDENDWNQVLRNCCVLYGWRIEKKTNRVVRATTPAFKLRDNISIPQPLQSERNAILNQSQQPRPIRTSPSSSNLPPPEADSDADSDEKISEASDETKSEVPLSEFEASATSVVASLEAGPLTTDALQVSIPSKPGAIPSYAINDNSKIEVAVVSHDFQKSMAENHFSATSFEASVSGGYAGYSVGVSGGMSSESSSGKIQSSKSFAKTMIATYKFPRVTIFLRPEDMEPTAELRAALDAVRKTKNINALRYIYSTFGHLFCLEVTVGGCLQTTKVVIGTEEANQSVEKESMKASVGIAVSTPIGVGGSMKASHETQDSKEQSQKETNTRETMVFEATGGNTILAADPPAWSASVADFNNWRVIDQTGLSPLADVIALIPGYSAVRSWFLKAIPKLSEYIIIPESRMLNVRFKTIGDKGLDHIAGKAEASYLAHNPDPNIASRPIRTSLERRASFVEIQSSVKPSFFGTSVDLTTTTIQVDVTTQDTMFFPHSTQSPTVIFPGLNPAHITEQGIGANSAATDIVSNDAVGTMGDPTLRHTLWSLEVPEKFSLGADCTVCIKSLANPSKPTMLTVYRNQQGVFLPTMTSSDEPSYWRIEPTISTNSETRVKDGDEVRLCWRFSDQVSGFRDYCDDLYGRRRTRKPVECNFESLYLKVPYPRFENISSVAGIALVMSPARTKDPIVESIKVLPKKGEIGEQQLNYCLHDLSFRLDTVGNNGLGDTEDYMNIVTAANSEVYRQNVTVNRQQQPAPMPSFADSLLSGGPEAVIAGCILGPIAAPISAVANILSSIFSF